jgi:hypothetical protein
MALVEMWRAMGLLVVFDYLLQRLVAGISRVASRKRARPTTVSRFFGR